MYYKEKVLKQPEEDLLASALFYLFNKRDWFQATLSEDNSKIIGITTIPSKEQRQTDMDSLRLRGGDVFNTAEFYEEQNKKEIPNEE